MQSDRTLSQTRGGGSDEGVAITLLGFAAALGIFLLVPPFLKADVGWVRMFTGQEAMDLLTPVIAMPALVLAIELTGRSNTWVRILLVALVAAWVSGQAIHLAANAIGDAFPMGPERDAFYATVPGGLDHFLDEELSHWLWHLAWVGLLGILLWVGSARSGPVATTGRRATWLASLAGCVHGFTWFIVTAEGGTWTLALAASAILVVLGGRQWRRPGSNRVVSGFLVAGSLTTVVLYGLWIALHGWTPKEICAVLGC